MATFQHQIGVMEHLCFLLRSAKKLMLLKDKGNRTGSGSNNGGGLFLFCPDAHRATGVLKKIAVGEQVSETFFIGKREHVLIATQLTFRMKSAINTYTRCRFYDATMSSVRSRSRPGQQEAAAT